MHPHHSACEFWPRCVVRAGDDICQRFMYFVFYFHGYLHPLTASPALEEHRIGSGAVLAGRNQIISVPVDIINDLLQLFHVGASLKIVYPPVIQEIGANDYFLAIIFRHLAVPPIIIPLYPLPLFCPPPLPAGYQQA